ncbi:MULTISPECIES: hypothetical protein [Paenibacillus]|uniref:Uncharacterized protein n=1 Tax=Paenibacillus naphthalenovorans TaxID=162209 RepID=A0A0U2W936_9BACL|nr:MULTISPECIES: hypothetical protein [Paenibacillus]ALS22974.1 hypothetical protein IJ22_26010 [Paenibacillus naphthalenovorans]NTZ17434.1 hypothetical protein [Paenibacillus sp. JMULE4]GCL71964.1 hypothetical protein PN4B1_18690 [Paenibacillus naphthalenovorans]SDI43762.1 hypothetical protein SAMN05421868_106146 [Paenibacillus naphthalenovorans]
MDQHIELLIDLFDKYTDEQIADLSDFSYEGRSMTREETLVVVSTFRASRIARGYINGGRTRQNQSG